MFSVRELRELFTRHRFRPLKRLGQNFLIDGNVKDKIIGAASVSKDDTVIEIGPGFGALTYDLAQDAGEVFAVEKDKALYKILSEGALGKASNVHLICGDIVDTDIEAIAGSKKVKIVGNLPYYATTPIIVFLIENRRFIKNATLTVQREVAVRLTSDPGTKEYGSISCFVQYYARLRYVHTITRECFYPHPEVDSSALRFDMLDSPSVSVADEELFFRIIRKAFNQRRKTIINSLTSKALGTIASKDALLTALETARISPSARPETLGLQDFADITRAVIAKSTH